MQIRKVKLFIFLAFFKSYIHRSYLHQILTLNSKYLCNANEIWRWKLLGSPLQLFPHVFHKLFRKNRSYDKNLQTFSYDHSIFFFLKHVRFEDL